MRKNIHTISPVSRNERINVGIKRLTKKSPKYIARRKLLRLSVPYLPCINLYNRSLKYLIFSSFRRFFKKSLPPKFFLVNRKIFLFTNKYESFYNSCAFLKAPLSYCFKDIFRIFSTSCVFTIDKTQDIVYNKSPRNLKNYLNGE